MSGSSSTTKIVFAFAAVRLGRRRPRDWDGTRVSSESGDVTVGSATSAMIRAASTAAAV